MFELLFGTAVVEAAMNPAATLTEPTMLLVGGLLLLAACIVACLPFARTSPV